MLCFKGQPNMTLWLWIVSRSVHEKVHIEAGYSYKYSSANRKASNGEIMTIFYVQNTAANYVKIITSKSMSAGGLRVGHATTHRNTSIRTHTSSCLQWLLSPHVQCVSAQELTAWGTSFKVWDWLHKSYLERDLPLTCLTHAELHIHLWCIQHTHTGTNPHTHYTYFCTWCVVGKASCVQIWKISPKSLIIATFPLIFLCFTDQCTQSKGYTAKSGNMRVWCQTSTSHGYLFPCL